MHAVDDRVDRGHRERPRAHHRGVVAGPAHRARRRGRSARARIAPDQVELGHARRPLLAAGPCRPAGPARWAAAPAAPGRRAGSEAPARSSAGRSPGPPVPVPPVPSVVVRVAGSRRRGSSSRAAGARVLAEERVELGGLLGLREVVAVLAVGGQHERVPDRRRVGAALRARHRDAARRGSRPRPRSTGGACSRRTRRPWPRRSCRSCRPRGSRSWRRCRCRTARSSRALCVTSAAWPSVSTRLPSRARQVLALAVGEHDLLDAGRAVAHAAAGERRVRAGHLERGDAAREAAEALGRVAVELGPDAEQLGRLADRLRPDVEDQLGVDGVVRGERRARRG